MSEKFNSGYGGYTCDQCHILLWSGIGGLEDKSRRKYIYNVKDKDVITVNEKAFCLPCVKEYEAYEASCNI